MPKHNPSASAAQHYAHYPSNSAADVPAPAPIVPEQTSPSSSHYPSAHLQQQHASVQQNNPYAHQHASSLHQDHVSALPSPATSPDIPSQSLLKRTMPYDSQQVEKKPRLDPEATATGDAQTSAGAGARDGGSPVSASPATPTSASPTTATSAPAQKKKHVCSTCDRAFTTSGHLARHTRVHTGERNHKCPFPGCETRCSRQDNLQQHYRIHLSPGSRRSNSSATRAAIHRAMNDQPRAGGARTGAGPKGNAVSMTAAAPNAPPPLAHATLPPPLAQAHMSYPPNPHAQLVSSGPPPPPPLAQSAPHQQAVHAQRPSVQQDQTSQQTTQSHPHPSYSAAETASPKAEVAPSAYSQSAYGLGSYSANQSSSNSVPTNSSANGSGTPNGNNAVNGHSHGSVSQPQSPAAQSTPISAAASAAASPVIGGHAAPVQDSSYPIYYSQQQQAQTSQQQYASSQAQYGQRSQHSPLSAQPMPSPVTSTSAYANGSSSSHSNSYPPPTPSTFYQQHHYPPQAYINQNNNNHHSSITQASSYTSASQQQQQQQSMYSQQLHRHPRLSGSHPSSGAPSPVGPRLDLPATSPTAPTIPPPSAGYSMSGSGRQNGSYGYSNHNSVALPPVSNGNSNAPPPSSSSLSNGNNSHFMSNGASYSSYQLNSPPPPPSSTASSTYSVASSHTSHTSYSSMSSAPPPGSGKHSPPPVLAPIQAMQKKTAFRPQSSFHNHPSSQSHVHPHPQAQGVVGAYSHAAKGYPS